MTDPDGGLYSTQDADSESEESKFFVWTAAEIRDVLDHKADAFTTTYGVTRHGNASTGSAHGFEGKNILEFVGGIDQRPTLAEARRKLLEAREKRVHPDRDRKVLTSNSPSRLRSQSPRRCGHSYRLADTRATLAERCYMPYLPQAPTAVLC